MVRLVLLVQSGAGMNGQLPTGWCQGAWTAKAMTPANSRKQKIAVSKLKSVEFPMTRWSCFISYLWPWRGDPGSPAALRLLPGLVA